MKYYLKIYASYLKMNLHLLFAHRANFLNNMVSSVAWGIFSVLSIVVLTSKADTVLGWTRDEILLLTGVYSLLMGLFHGLFTRNFEKFSEIFHKGSFDLILTKPLDSQFTMSFTYFSYSALMRVVIGILVIGYIALKSPLTLNSWSILGFFIFLLVGLAILYNVWLIILASTIRFTNLSNLPEFMYSFTGISRYPAEIIKEGFYYAFIFLFPLTLIVNTPVKLIINKATLFDLALSVFSALVLTLIGRKIWLIALRSYTSAGG